MMNVANDRIVCVLNGLIVTCKDGQEGFHNAGSAVKSEDLKKLFGTYEQQCRKLMAELRPEILSLGGDPDKGTASKGLHRGWRNLEQALSGATDTAVLAEAARSEDLAVQSYKEALKEDLPPSIRTLILRQYKELKQVHERITEFKWAVNYSA